MSFRKKSTTTEESSSSTSSGSSGSSASSSASQSGSSSSDSDSSTSTEEKPASDQVKPVESEKSHKARRKSSSDFKGHGKNEEKSNSKARNLMGVPNPRLSRSTIYSSDDEVPPSKKINRSNSGGLGSNSRKKLSAEMKKNNSIAALHHPPANGGGKAPPAVVKQHQQQNFASKIVSSKTKAFHTAAKSQVLSHKKIKKKSIFSPANSSDSAVEEVIKKPEKKTKTANQKGKSATTAKSKTAVTKARPQPKQKLTPNKPTTDQHKSSDEVESDSGSSSPAGSSSSSDSDASESSDTSSSPPSKRAAQKKSIPTKTPTKSDIKPVVLSDSEGEPPTNYRPTAPRKLTRSLSTRRSKHVLGTVSGSESEGELDKRSISKSPTKKASVVTKSKAKVKTKREIKTEKISTERAVSPPLQEQKCPIEGCDSSGHLSGNLDTHFLPEACPIFHNMSASECKERASERKLKEEEYNLIVNQMDLQKKIITPEQKEYQLKIREARARFKPLVTHPIHPIHPAHPSHPSHPSHMSLSEKLRNEKECADHDREPNLVGLVPDYDLQLFREAQAIASESIENELKGLPVGKGIKYITMGKYQMKVWYQSPYPEDAARLPKMYICEFCLRYQKSETGIKRHAQKCMWRHPPGDEIYRKGKLQVWQVDGKRHKQYCQHLCLLAKFFLDHKTLYHDVEPFLFYVMTLADIDGCHIVGYFSKEKNSFYNVSCILTLPPYQRKGYGRLLIDFSYLLTRVENKIGSPEKPLSDLGLISYRSYWKDVLLDFLCNRTGTTLSIKDVSKEMAIYSYDIVSTLQALGMMKYWKGKHIVLKKQDVLDEFEERLRRRGNFPKIDDNCLRWSPFVPPNPSSTL